MNEPIHPLQAMIDGMGAAWQKERAKTQMTLGTLITTLEGLGGARKIVGLCRPMSYRGYYSDLAFDPCCCEITVAEALKTARGCMGQVFEGYKGGDFQMGAMTPIWAAEYGNGGLRILGLDTGKDPITLVVAPEKA